jgi:hypothetical protein
MTRALVPKADVPKFTVPASAKDVDSPVSALKRFEVERGNKVVVAFRRHWTRIDSNGNRYSEAKMRSGKQPPLTTWAFVAPSIS